MRLVGEDKLFAGHFIELLPSVVNLAVSWLTRFTLGGFGHDVATIAALRVTVRMGNAVVINREGIVFKEEGFDDFNVLLRL